MQVTRDEETGAKSVRYDATISNAKFVVTERDQMGHAKGFKLYVTLTASWEYNGESCTQSRRFDVTDLIVGKYDSRQYREMLLQRLRGKEIVLISCKQRGQERATWFYDEERIKTLLNG